jgi:hypothetical protein
MGTNEIGLTCPHCGGEIEVDLYETERVTFISRGEIEVVCPVAECGRTLTTVLD